MKAYFLRRLLLVPITMIGVTLLVFSVTRIVPGGPVERAMQEASSAGDEGSSGGGAAQRQGGLSEEGIEEVERQFHYDKSIPVAYLMWLGVIPANGGTATRNLPKAPRKPSATPSWRIPRPRRSSS